MVVEAILYVATAKKAHFRRSSTNRQADGSLIAEIRRFAYDEEAMPVINHGTLGLMQWLFQVSKSPLWLTLHHLDCRGVEGYELVPVDSTAVVAILDTKLSGKFIDHPALGVLKLFVFFLGLVTQRVDKLGVKI